MSALKLGFSKVRMFFFADCLFGVYLFGMFVLLSFVYNLLITGFSDLGIIGTLLESWLMPQSSGPRAWGTQRQAFRGLDPRALRHEP